MVIEPTIFREYDIRGLVDKDLPDEAVRAIHRAYGRFLLRRGINNVLVARDGRAYNDNIKKVVIAALLESGLNVIDIGTVTVPVFYFGQIHLKIVGGVMITASHNPAGWSGFKHLVDFLKTATSDELNEIQEIIAKEDFPSGQGNYTNRADLIDKYKKDILSRIHIPQPPKVVVDSGNETTALINPDVLRQLGCEVVEQCTTMGEACQHEPNPSTLGALNHIAEGIKLSGAQIGVGYDADGDRFGIVDELGNIIWPDRVAMVIARSMLGRYPGGTVVFDVKCTQALIDEIVACGGKPVMWKTGHSWIRRKGQEVDAIFAAERSGHFYFRRDHYGYDDGLYASLRFLEIISAQEKPLSEYMKEYPKYETSPVWHAPCPDKKKYQVDDQLVAQFKKDYGEDRVIDINGARVRFDDGWRLVRASSNIPALVLVFEGKDAFALERIDKIFRDILKLYQEVGLEWESG